MNWQDEYKRWAIYREAIRHGFYDDWSIADTALIERVLRCPIKIEQTIDELEFDAVVLELPVVVDNVLVQ
jgi:hypothetical protein